MTAQLLTGGLIDTLLSALSAVEEVGADHVNAWVVAWGALGILTALAGDALPQIEDKLRAIPSALRYAFYSKITFVADFGLDAGTFATIVAGACLTLLPCLDVRTLAGSKTHGGDSQSLGEG